MNSISADLNLMIKACEKASKVLIRDFGELENLQVTKKGPKDFVTNSDKKVEKILIEELEKYRKNFSFLTEENGKIENKDKENIWIIDPIDGTNNFLHGIPHFSISIGLKSKNEIIAGVIYDPIKNELFFGEKDNGSYINNHRIRVSEKNKLDECLFASTNSGIKSDNLTTRNLGSAALDLAYVGAGRFDGYFQNNLHIWDVAAGIIIVKEAGGTVNNLNLSQIENLNIRASSNTIYEKMLEKLTNF